jgi:hypothetical protein
MHAHFLKQPFELVRTLLAIRDTITLRNHRLASTANLQQQGKDSATGQANMQTVPGTGGAQPEMWRDIIISCFRPVSSCRR